MIRTRGLSHINLNVAEVARSIRFDRELFGMEVIHDYEGAMGPYRHGRQVVLSSARGGRFDRHHAYSGRAGRARGRGPFRVHAGERR